MHIGTTRNLGRLPQFVAITVAAMIPMYIWPSAPMFMIPLLELTAIPSATIRSGIILMRTSLKDLMFLNGMDMMIQ